MRIEVDGQPVGGDVGFHANSTYGHFTSMQVRDGAVQGLDRHLERLDAANRELFGRPLDGDLVRDRIRHALDGEADAAVRVVVRAPAADRVSLLVAVEPPVSPPARPLRLASAAYLRPFAHIKHLGGFAQAEHGRRARQQGYDDALLVGPDGTISETTIANIGFFDAESGGSGGSGGDDRFTVVWPDEPWLHGTAMQLVERALAERGTPSVRRTIRLADVSSYRGAFVANSRGVAPVAEIDRDVLPVDEALMGDLVALLAAVPWDKI